MVKPLTFLRLRCVRASSWKRRRWRRLVEECHFLPSRDPFGGEPRHFAMQADAASVGARDGRTNHGAAASIRSPATHFVILISSRMPGRSCGDCPQTCRECMDVRSRRPGLPLTGRTSPTSAFAPRTGALRDLPAAMPLDPMTRTNPFERCRIHAPSSPGIPVHCHLIGLSEHSSSVPRRPTGLPRRPGCTNPCPDSMAVSPWTCAGESLAFQVNSSLDFSGWFP